MTQFTNLEKKLLLFSLALVVMTMTFAQQPASQDKSLTQSIEQPLPGLDVSKEVFRDRLVQVVFSEK